MGVSVESIGGEWSGPLVIEDARAGTGETAGRDKNQKGQKQ